MEEIRTIARKWGNSIAVIIPKDMVERKKIRENSELVIEVKRRPIAGEIFGMFPRKSKRTAQEIKDEMKAGW